MRTDQTSHDTANSRRNAEQVCNGVGIEKLVLNTNRASLAAKEGGHKGQATYGDLLLCYHDSGILTPYSNGGMSGA